MISPSVDDSEFLAFASTFSVFYHFSNIISLFSFHGIEKSMKNGFLFFFSLSLRSIVESFTFSTCFLPLKELGFWSLAGNGSHIGKTGYKITDCRQPTPENRGSRHFLTVLLRSTFCLFHKSEALFCSSLFGFIYLVWSVQKTLIYGFSDQQLSTIYILFPTLSYSELKKSYI